MPFRELDPAIAWKSIEGYQDELSAEKKGLDAFYRQFRCQNKDCGGQVQKETDPRHCFSDPNTLVARALLRCTTCRMLFDPHNGVILERGDPNKILNVPIVGQK